MTVKNPAKGGRYVAAAPDSERIFVSGTAPKGEKREPSTDEKQAAKAAMKKAAEAAAKRKASQAGGENKEQGSAAQQENEK